MATIVADIPGADGVSTVEGYAGKVDALAICEQLRMTTAGGTRIRKGRTVGKAKFGDIQLIRHVDKASPKLREFCSTGKDLGTVKIHLFRSVEEGAKVYFTYTLAKAYVSRVEVLTADHTSQAYTEHRDPQASSDWNRLQLAPMFPVAPGLSGAKEVEHVWFNAAQVWWTYTPYEQGDTGGNVEKAWDILAAKVPTDTKPA